MILTLDSGEQIKGDLIIQAALRYDLAPVPVTLEADFRADEALIHALREGQVLTTGHGDRLKIISSRPVMGGVVRDESLDSAVRIVAFLEPCAPIAYVRERAIIQSNKTLHAIYRAAGCALQSVAADFPVPRFVCMTGDTPSMHIARVLQEAGGVVTWRGGKLQFLRLPDLFKQKPTKQLPNVASDDVQSGFLERHEVPFFFTVDATGAIKFGDRAKARTAIFAPHQNVASMHNMTHVLVRRKVTKTGYDASMRAGDLIDFIGGDKLAIITACHYYASGTDRAGAQQQYTKLWLGGLL